MDRVLSGPSARELWCAFETCHILVYFAPESKAVYESTGLKGGWMGYFASRAAAMGPVPAEVVAATFYNFHPEMVRRAIPDAWSLAPIDRILRSRYKIVDRALTRALGEWVETEEARGLNEILRTVVRECPFHGRPLFAAHAALPWPTESHLQLWHACTLLREHRGDGHVAALVAAGLDGLEAHVTACASGTSEAAAVKPFRGWSEREWAAAEDRLRERGLLDGDGALTQKGQTLRTEVERKTDELAEAPWRGLSPRERQSVMASFDEPVHRILAQGEIPFPNPVGLSRP